MDGGVGAGLLSSDLESWLGWSRSRRRLDSALRRVKGAVVPTPGRRTPEEHHDLWLPAGTPRVLVVVDGISPSYRAAVVEALPFFDPQRTAVLARAEVAHALAGDLPEGAVRHPYTGPADLPGTIEVVLSLGGYLGLSEPLVAWAGTHGARFVVVQHGLLTPWAPPAPQGAHVLAWSEADAAFWSAGRPDVSTSVVGSQLLWNATTDAPVPTTTDRPLVLGQLHGAELPRRETFFTYWEFCREVLSDYRPHPNERDAVSWGLHEVMRRGGIAFETSGEPLTRMRRPVVSIFSTGTLEAAQRGLPAWVFHPDPPTWVEQFWDRYGLARYGSAPTTPWEMPGGEPARRVAETVEGLA